MHNLHAKYLAENPDKTVSRSFFCTARKANFVLASFGSRQTCLCQRHQNMSLKLQALKQIPGLTATTTNADVYTKAYSDEWTVGKITDATDVEVVKYSEWRRVDVTYKEKPTKRIQIVQCQAKREAFCDLVKRELVTFRRHVDRVTAQYTAVRQLKEKMPTGQAFVHMDFGENYLCSQADEVQSAYFAKVAVTLHPSVVYYRTEKDGPLQHKSFVVVSDELAHNSATVITIIRTLIPEIRALIPNLSSMNYVTDSPTSQYRNSHAAFRCLTQSQPRGAGVLAVFGVWTRQGAL